MSNITEKIEALGYSLSELDKIDLFGELGLTIIFPPPPPDCPYDSCYGGCTPQCFSCKNGNK